MRLSGVLSALVRPDHVCWVHDGPAGRADAAGARALARWSLLGLDRRTPVVFAEPA